MGMPNREKRPARATPTPKRREYLRIHGARLEALTKADSGDATKQPKTQRGSKQVSIA